MFDIITGIIKALHNDGLNSTKLRKGLYHKLAEVIVLIGSGLMTSNGVSLGVDFPLLPCVSGYICIMELISCIENISEVNPTLARFFSAYLEKLNKNLENKDGEEIDKKKR